MSIRWPFKNLESRGYIKCNLKDLRFQRKLTQREVATAVGVSRELISMIESGVKFPSLKTSVGIAKFLKVTIEELYILNSTSKLDEAEEFELEIKEMLRKVHPEINWNDSLH